MEIWIRRAYEPPARGDGQRLLIDGIWPRGVAKQQLKIEAWLRDAAPSTRLRQWFDHDPERWEEFRERYFAELDQRRDVVEDLLRRAKAGRITLVYAARDPDYNNAVALREYLRARRSSPGRR
ncbi:DUF488 family protein [Myxococcota bacterium]|nr:DUF488 family protein [Myxococcota bacterium]MCZ7617850.1 DUF488 family protein [Myxococcota bacterium]